MSVPARAEELRAALETARRIPVEGGSPTDVLVLAPGATAPVVEALGALDVQVPLVRAGVVLPAHVGPGSLVVSLGRSRGELDVALVERAGAHGARTVALELADNGYGVAPASLVGAALVLLARVGVVADPSAALEAAATQLERRARSAEAVELARAIGRTFPVVWGVAGLGAAAAGVWRDEVALRTKAPALSASLPDATLVDVAGFGLSGDVTRQLFSLVRLELDDEPGVLRARTDAALEAIRETVVAVHRVSGAGAGSLAQALDLFLLGEQLARELAAAEGVDPDAVAVLDDLERVPGATS